MKIKSFSDEWYQDYKYPSMFICADSCDMKCCSEGGNPALCQNSHLINEKSFDVDIAYLFKRYSYNPITKAIVIGGLEPMLQKQDIVDLICLFRSWKCNDDFVIYTGYTEEELADFIEAVKYIPNIVIKFGRYIPNCEPHFDDVLGVELASPNQYARRIS